MNNPVKKWLSLVTVIILFSFGNSYAINKTANLIGGWRFEGNANDWSGNGNHGSVSGASLSIGKFGQAYSFDGNDDYIDLPPNVGLNEKGTVSLWFKANDIVSVQYLWIDAQDGDNENRIYIANGNLIFGGYDNGAYQYMLASSISDANWHHVVGVFQDNDARLYFDGVNVGSDTSVNMDAYPHNYIKLGFSPIHGIHFNGSIDEVRIYNRALNEAEIRMLMLDYEPGEF